MSKAPAGAKYALAYRRADGVEMSLRTAEYWSSLKLAKAAAREKNDKLSLTIAKGKYVVIEL